MSSQKIQYTQKELKQPDKFRAFIIKVVNKAEENFSKILYIFSIAVVVLLVVLTFTSYQDNLSEKAGVELGKALEFYNNGNAKEALGSFSNIISEYPNQQAAKLAMYYSGTIHYESEQYEKSIHDMLRYLSSSPNTRILEDSANLTVGLAYYNIQKWEDAVKFLSKIDDSSSLYRHQGKLNLALSYEKLGQDKKAREIYKNVLLESVFSPNVPIDIQKF